VSGVRREVPPAVVARLRPLCARLPEAREEPAWTGTRWRIRTKTFAHVVMIDDGWPPAYARAAATDGPLAVLTFRAAGPDLDALTHMGPPFFSPPWFRDIVGLALGDDTDWDEVAELVTESYRLLAPQKLAVLVDPPRE
jgi:hypothetical protein